MSLILAFLADLCFGDPQYWFHPVRIMGRTIENAETFLRRHISAQRLAGALLAIIFPLLVFGAVWLVLFWAGKINFILAQVINVLGIYTALSVHDLKKEGDQIFQDLENHNLDKARSDLARIVGRDTQYLDEQEIVRATVETIAESTVDGIIAPLLYAALGGAPLALAYKAVNTLDSMIGHMNDHYRDFGFVAAMQDHWINWIPARLAYIVTVIASVLIKSRPAGAWAIGWRHGMLCKENSSVPEATFAGALGIRLGGCNMYQSRAVQKPFLGMPHRPLDRGVILESIQLMVTSSWVTLLICLVIYWGMGHGAQIR